jgi:hypothetical protein
MYYDRQGRLVSAAQWQARFNDARYKIVARDRVNGWLVSTVWLGLDYSFGSGPPLIFETMVFSPGNDPEEEYCDRYATEAQARAGHRYALAHLAERITVIGEPGLAVMLTVVPDDLAET